MIALRTAATVGSRIVVSFFCRLHVLLSYNEDVSYLGHTSHQSTDLFNRGKVLALRQKQRSGCSTSTHNKLPLISSSGTVDEPRSGISNRPQTAASWLLAR